MHRDDVDWKGYWAACPTPFTEDGRLDTGELTRLLQHYADQGLHGVLVNGTTGEWFSQTPQERRTVAATAMEAVGGRMTVVVGCTDYTATGVAELARHALEVGADGVATTPPPYSKPFPDEIVAFYEDVCAALDGPVMAYNWPHGTSVDMEPSLLSRLADVPGVVAVKDSTPDAERFFETNRRCNDRVRVFGPFMSREGLGRLTADGGDGTIGGGSLFGRADARFWEDVWAGDLDAAAEHARRTEELFPRLWLPGGWAGVHGAYQSQLKELMRMLGQPGGHVRRPRLPVTDPAALADLRDALESAGLLEVAR